MIPGAYQFAPIHSKALNRLDWRCARLSCSDRYGGGMRGAWKVERVVPKRSKRRLECNCARVDLEPRHRQCYIRRQTRKDEGPRDRSGQLLSDDLAKLIGEDLGHPATDYRQVQKAGCPTVPARRLRDQ